MDTPTQILSAEHQNILRVIDAMESECELLNDGSAPDITFFNRCVDFIKHYADGFHHAKEEDILFARLGGGDIAMPPGPVNQMLREHDMGREFVSGLVEGIGKGDTAQMTENARAYCHLLKQHIYKEDNILYPMADQALGKEDQDEMLHAFERAEKEQFSADEVAGYLQFAESCVNRHA
ncbi:MAG: hemerythrin domain-containing protein [Flavobacteriales bacterium]